MNLISIIVPAYNAGKTLNSCIDSIITQSYCNYEVIIVNDGSNDETSAICEHIIKIDNRFKAIHKQNGGVSSARNEGLKAARGEWICFVDSDDTLKPDALKKMFSLTGNDCDIVVAGYETFNNKPFKLPLHKTAIKSNVELALELFVPSDYKYLGYPWAKLFRRSVITDNHLSFDEALFYNEDRLFNLIFLLHARKGAYTTEPVYNYYIRDNGAMASIKGPSYWKFETDLDAFIKMNVLIGVFESKDLCKIVLRQTYYSYRYNRWLNKNYGHNNRHTNHRLKSKIRTALTLRQFLFITINRHISAIKSTVYNSYIRLVNDHNEKTCKKDI